MSEVKFFGLGKQSLLDDRRELHENLVRVIRQVRPQRVVTWSPERNWRGSVAVTLIISRLERLR